MTKARDTSVNDRPRYVMQHAASDRSLSSSLHDWLAGSTPDTILSSQETYSFTGLYIIIIIIIIILINIIITIIIIIT